MACRWVSTADRPPRRVSRTRRQRRSSPCRRRERNLEPGTFRHSPPGCAAHFQGGPGNVHTSPASPQRPPAENQLSTSTEPGPETVKRKAARTLRRKASPGLPCVLRGTRGTIRSGVADLRILPDTPIVPRTSATGSARRFFQHGDPAHTARPRGKAGRVGELFPSLV